MSQSKPLLSEPIYQGYIVRPKRLVFSHNPLPKYPFAACEAISKSMFTTREAIDPEKLPPCLVIISEEADIEKLKHLMTRTEYLGAVDHFRQHVSQLALS